MQGTIVQLQELQGTLLKIQHLGYGVILIDGLPSKNCTAKYQLNACLVYKKKADFVAEQKSVHKLLTSLNHAVFITSDKLNHK